LKSTLDVGPAEAGLRVDRFLVRHLTGMTRQRVSALLDAGRVTVNGVPGVQPTATLKTGDLVDVLFGTAAEADPASHVLHHDAAFRVCFKPAGGLPPRPPAPVRRPGRGRARGPSERAVLGLDRRASGVMVIAHTTRAWQNLTSQFESGRAGRRYTVLVATPLARAPVAGPEYPGWTFRLKKRFRDAALLDVVPPPSPDADPLTALAAAGLRPVRLSETGTSRLALHQRSVTLHPPGRGRPMVFDPPLPPSFRRLLDALVPPAALAGPAQAAAAASHAAGLEPALRSPRVVLQTAPLSRLPARRAR
jgi:hypothetical protein